MACPLPSPPQPPSTRPAGYDPDGDKQRYVHAVGGAWAVWWACQIFWISLLHAASPATTWLALLFALVALAALCSALKTLHVLRRRFGSPSSPLLYVLYFFPTSVAAAWTAVLSALTLLASLAGQAGAREALWASAALALALGAAGSAAVLLSRDTALGLALVWALLGSYEASPAPVVQRCALLAIAALLVACLLSVLRRRASAPAADPLDDPEARIALRYSSLEQ